MDFYWNVLSKGLGFVLICVFVGVVISWGVDARLHRRSGRADSPIE